MLGSIIPRPHLTEQIFRKLIVNGEGRITFCVCVKMWSLVVFHVPVDGFTYMPIWVALDLVNYQKKKKNVKDMK